MNFLSLRGIPYYPELGKITGGISSAILMTQLEYWFNKMNNKPFYKFLEACDHASYKEGESWVEELGMSKDEFRLAFSKIGTTYKSKKEFDKSEDKFQGKFYCSYIDRIERRTYYFRNSLLIESALKIIFENEDTKKTNDKTSDFYKSGKSISRSGESQSLEVEKVDFYKSGIPTSNNSILLQEITTEDYQENKTITTTTETPNKSQNSSSAISENIKNIRDYLLKNVKGINGKTCNNIIFSVENLDIQLERVIRVVEYANKYQKQIGYICDALKYNWVIPSISVNTKKEKGRGHKINSKAITIAKESKEEVSEYTETLEQLTERYNSLDEKLKNEIDKLALKKALKINPVERMAKVLVRTTTRLEVLRQYIQEGKI